MNYWKKSFVITTSLMLVSFANTAKAGPQKTTEHGYDQEKFCDALSPNGAKTVIENLNKTTEAAVKDINDLKTKINDLEAKRVLLKGVTDLKNDYLEAFKHFDSDEERNEEKKKVKAESISNFRKLMNSSLALKSLSLLLKDGKPSSVTPTIKSLCESPLNKKDKDNFLFCSRYGEQGNWRGMGNSATSEQINILLKNYTETMDKVANDDKADLTDNVKKIIESIPEEIKPSGTLELLKAKGDDFFSLISKASEEKSLAQCLEDNKNCRSLLENDNRENLNNILIAQMQATEQALGENYKKVKAKIDGNMSEEFGKILHTFDNPLEKRNNNSIKNFKDLLVKHKNALTNKDGLNLDENKYNEFLAACEINDGIKGEELAKKAATCADQVRPFVEGAQNKIAEIEKEEKDLKAKYEDLLKGNNLYKLERVEYLKQFVLQRYVRECPEAKTNQLDSNLNNISCTDLAGTLKNSNLPISDLAKNLAQTISMLKNESNASTKAGELGTFSKDELKNYTAFCQQMQNDGYDKDQKSLIDNTCKKVSEYQSAIANKRELSEWKEFNEKYYVKYDESADGHYVAIEKKSNGRILGEGVSQSIGQIYPMLFTNMAMTGQINYMTNQALFQKQMNYVYDPTSPWMMNQMYFQGNYLPTFPSAMPNAGYNFGP